MDLRQEVTPMVKSANGVSIHVDFEPLTEMVAEIRAYRRERYAREQRAKLSEASTTSGA